MNNNYINFYNNLIHLTRNKNLYKDFTNHDTFSDRLVIFLFHFAFWSGYTEPRLTHHLLLLYHS